MADLTPGRMARLRSAFEVARPGYDYTRQHFGPDRGTYVGHTPADIHTEAMDTIMRLLPALLDEIAGLREIVTNLAEYPSIGCSGVCVLCGLLDHHPRCPWRMAREAVDRG